jgi:pimeloyl-ACP methyl ester carboxylesterase
MGLSSHDPKRTILSYPADILELASHLQIPQFRVLSVSGGGPYAFACLNSIPAQQCLGGQIISSIYPLKFGTLGMSSMHRAMMFLSYWVPGFLGWLVNWQLGNAARNPDPNVLKDMIKKSLNGLPQRDREAVENSDFGLVMMDAARECFVKGGSEGITLETHLLTLDWGFELEDVDLAGRDLTIWHGKLDVNCPMGMAEKAAPLLKGAQTKFLDREGHSLVAHQTEAILKSFLPVPT